MDRNALPQDTAFGVPLDTAAAAERDAVYGFGRIGRAPGGTASTIGAGVDAPAASAAIETFLGSRAPVPDPEPTLAAIRDAVAQFAALPLAAGDAECRRLVSAMALAPDPQALLHMVERLERHVAALLAGETQPVAAVPEAGAISGGRPRLLLKL